MMRLRSGATFALLAITLGMTCTGATVTDPRPLVPSGFAIDVIAHVSGARELAALPNGDLLVATNGSAIAIVPEATGAASAAETFVHLPDEVASGIALAGDTIYIGTHFGVWRVPYHAGDRRASAEPVRIASVRTSGEPRGHSTTSIAVAGDTLYASVGSSCNECDPELDATRATIQSMHLDGTAMHARAIHIRNAIALAIDPTSNHLWAGVAGQDELAPGHPYEIFDDVSAERSPVADYGWPHCYENRRPKNASDDCSNVAIPQVVFPAYETPIGAVFYPARPTGPYAFPPAFAGGAFVTLHGSWHRPLVPPRVVFVPMHAGERTKALEPRATVDWQTPTAQWHEFISGLQTDAGERIGRPTGIAVGPDGSLFVGDDEAGVVYRIRPARAGGP